MQVRNKGTYKFLINNTPNRYISRALVRKPRKQSNVIGCALRRQLRSPCWGSGLRDCCSMATEKKTLVSNTGQARKLATKTGAYTLTWLFSGRIVDRAE